MFPLALLEPFAYMVVWKKLNRIRRDCAFPRFYYPGQHQALCIRDAEKLACRRYRWNNPARLVYVSLLLSKLQLRVAGKARSQLSNSSSNSVSEGSSDYRSDIQNPYL